MNIIKRFGFVKLIIGLVIVILFFVFLFRKRIAEHQVTRAKIEMLKRLSTSPPAEWDDEIKEVYDSMFLQKQDTIIEIIE